MGIERTIRPIKSYIRFSDKFTSLHIDASSESTRTIGRCTGTTLHLHVFYTRSKIRKIYPKHRMTFGIVNRYPIGGNIDSCTICTSNSDRSITDASTGITRTDSTRCHTQQIGEVLPQILLLKLLLIDVGICHWSSSCGTCRNHFNFLQMSIQQTIG